MASTTFWTLSHPQFSTLYHNIRCAPCGDDGLNDALKSVRSVHVRKLKLMPELNDDAGMYVCGVLQHVIEIFVSGALASMAMSGMRGEADMHADIQTQHLQYYVRTNEEMWRLFNSTFTLQVILSVYLDRTTETFFRGLGLPIHDKDTLTSCDYYTTAVANIQPRRLTSMKHGDQRAAKKWLSLTTPALLTRIAAGVNPLCSLSPKACMMTGAVVHEVFLVLFEKITQSQPDVRVVNKHEVTGGIQEAFPYELVNKITGAAELRVANRKAQKIIWNNPTKKWLMDEKNHQNCRSGSVDEDVRVCIWRLQGTRLLLKKTFRVTSQCLLFTVFAKACDRLQMDQRKVVFVHDGILLSARQRAGTLRYRDGSIAVQVFAVCRRGWTSRQRALARRGLLTEQVDHTNTTRPAWNPGVHQAQTNHLSKKKLKHTGSTVRTEGPLRRHPPEYTPTTASTAQLSNDGPRTSTHNHHHVGRDPPVEVNWRPKSRSLTDSRERLRPLPDESQPEAARGENSGMRSGVRRRRRVETPPLEDGRPLGLTHLGQGRLLPPRPPGNGAALFRDMSQDASALAQGPTTTLAGNTGEETSGGEVDFGGMAVLDRAARRLLRAEECLRDLGDSLQELRSGGQKCWPSDWPTGVPDLALGAMTSQLHTARNFSDMFRHVLSAVNEDDHGKHRPDQEPFSKNHQSGLSHLYRKADVTNSDSSSFRQPKAQERFEASIQTDSGGNGRRKRTDTDSTTKPVYDCNQYVVNQKASVEQLPHHSRNRHEPRPNKSAKENRDDARLEHRHSPNVDPAAEHARSTEDTVAIMAEERNSERTLSGLRLNEHDATAKKHVLETGLCRWSDDLGTCNDPCCGNEEEELRERSLNGTQPHKGSVQGNQFETGQGFAGNDAKWRTERESDPPTAAERRGVASISSVQSGDETASVEVEGSRAKSPASERRRPSTRHGEEAEEIEEHNNMYRASHDHHGSARTIFASYADDGKVIEEQGGALDDLGRWSDLGACDDVQHEKINSRAKETEGKTPKMTLGLMLSGKPPAVENDDTQLRKQLEPAADRRSSGQQEDLVEDGHVWSGGPAEATMALGAAEQRALDQPQQEEVDHLKSNKHCEALSGPHTSDLSLSASQRNTDGIESKKGALESIGRWSDLASYHEIANGDDDSGVGENETSVVTQDQKSLETTPASVNCSEQGAKSGSNGTCSQVGVESYRGADAKQGDGQIVESSTERADEIFSTMSEAAQAKPAAAARKNPHQEQAEGITQPTLIRDTSVAKVDQQNSDGTLTTLQPNKGHVITHEEGVRKGGPWSGRWSQLETHDDSRDEDKIDDGEKKEESPTMTLDATGGGKLPAYGMYSDTREVPSDSDKRSRVEQELTIYAIGSSDELRSGSLEATKVDSIAAERSASNQRQGTRDDCSSLKQEKLSIAEDNHQSDGLQFPVQMREHEVLLQRGVPESSGRWSDFTLVDNVHDGQSDCKDGAGETVEMTLDHILTAKTERGRGSGKGTTPTTHYARDRVELQSERQTGVEREHVFGTASTRSGNEHESRVESDELVTELSSAAKASLVDSNPYAVRGVFENAGGDGLPAKLRPVIMAVEVTRYMARRSSLADGDVRAPVPPSSDIADRSTAIIGEKDTFDDDELLERGDDDDDDDGADDGADWSSWVGTTAG